MFCRLISSVLVLSIFIGCQPKSPYERRPGLFQKPYKEEEFGSFRVRTYRSQGATRYPFSIVELNGRELPLKNAHIRYAHICHECLKHGSEAVAFQLFTSDEKLRGTWVLQIKNQEQKYFHIGSTNGVEGLWDNTNFQDFDAILGNCAPEKCESYTTLIQ